MAYEVHPLGENSWRIEDDFVRIFLFAGRDQALLVDTGFGTGDLLALVREHTDLPVLLVNTHADPDHTGGNAAFDTAAMHPAEFADYEQKAGADSPVQPLWEGDKIDLGGRSFEVILIPGHTPGSIALLDRAARVIIAGDTVADSPVFIFGEERSLPALIESLKKLEALSDSYDTVYASHGSFPLGTDAVTRQRETAERLLAGELSPLEPPMDIPAKMYLNGNAGFFY
jgi:glyoxylase-like metal-dependent hydrolase (beta-lactamase superfamily II)